MKKKRKKIKKISGLVVFVINGKKKKRGLVVFVMNEKKKKKKPSKAGRLCDQ